MISSLAKVMGLPSYLLLEKTEDQKSKDTTNMVLELEHTINVTAMITIFMQLIIFNIGSQLIAFFVVGGRGYCVLSLKVRHGAVKATDQGLHDVLPCCYKQVSWCTESIKQHIRRGGGGGGDTAFFLKPAFLSVYTSATSRTHTYPYKRFDNIPLWVYQKTLFLPIPTSIDCQY